ncbi:MAG: hypothetical protein ABIH99_01300 [Candidatus Micrarchaeota archaeon]
MPKESIEIKACSRCGSTELKWIGGGAESAFDVIGATALSNLAFCPVCNANILPITFDSQADYCDFLAYLKEPGESDSSELNEPKPEQRTPEPPQSVNLARGYTGISALGGVVLTLLGILYLLLALLGIRDLSIVSLVVIIHSLVLFLLILAFGAILIDRSLGSGKHTSNLLLVALFSSMLLFVIDQLIIFGQISICTTFWVILTVAIYIAYSKSTKPATNS